MKQAYLGATLLFLFLQVTTCFSQELEFTEEFPETSGKFIGVSDEKVISYKKNHTAIPDLTTLEYGIMDPANPEKKQLLLSQPKFTKGTGVSFNRLFLQGDFIYELHVIKDKDRTIGIGIIKRVLSNLQEVLGSLELDEWEVNFDESDPEGFYLLSSINLYRINLNLEVVWKKGFESFSDKNIRLNNIEVDNRLNLIMSLSVNKNTTIHFQDSIPVSKSELFLIITDKSGTQKLIKPKVPESIYVKYARFNYHNEDRELIGLFLTSESVKAPPPKKIYLGIGYAYFRWNDDGGIITARNHAFSLREFTDENLKKYAEYYRFKTEKEGFSRTNYNVTTSHVKFLGNGNVLYISHTLMGVVAPLQGSKLVYLLSPDGDVLWTKLIPLNDNELYWSGDFFIDDNKLHFLIREFIASYEKGKYDFKFIRSMVNGKTVLLADRVVDLENGQEISNQPLIANPSEKFHPQGVIFNQDKKIVVRYSSPSNKLERLLLINY
nr:hypothetical protein [uncultured Fluviicola sp.]